MRRRPILSRIGGQRSVPIAIAWLLSLSAASQGRDDGAPRPSGPSPSGGIVTGAVVVGKTPGRPPRGEADDPGANKVGPRDARDYAALGDDHAESGELDKAIADYSAAIKLDARYAHAYSKRASVWFRKHERPKAIADYSAAIALEPTNPLHFLSRAAVWSRSGDHVPAIADFDEAIRLDPNDPGAYVARAREWEMDYQLDRAISDFQRAIALDPRSTVAYEGRGRIWGKRGEYAKVVANFAELTRATPDNPVGHRELAWLLATCDEDTIRDGRRALGEAAIACRLTKSADPRCLETLAAAYAEVGDFDIAVRWQARALELFAASNDRFDLRIKKRQDADMHLRLYRYRRRMPHRENPERVVR
jgi:tetratricopeptide (TPR) repeat protein